MATSDNKRVAKNATMLSLRTLLAIIIGLYTSRIVLSTLGVEDFGIYGVVGSIVTIFCFLNVSMAGATSRFLTFELGQGDDVRISRTFSTAFIVHLIIAGIVLLGAESIGLWFLNYRMNIPPERMYAANWVYQFSILATIVNITQVPYSAVIMSHERMGVYAYFEILNTLLQLLIVYLLAIGDFDKLILYAILTFAVSLMMISLKRIYCIRKFRECRLIWIWDKSYMLPMLKFSFLDLYGNMCATVNDQTRPILINIFFGVIFNAAASLAQTVNNAILSMTNTVLTAFRPQIIKLYAKGMIQQMQAIMAASLKFTLLAYAIVIIPCCFDAHYILQLWLGQVPPYASIFLRVMALTTLIDISNRVINVAIHATGDIRRLSFHNGSLYLAIPLLTYVAYKLGFPAWVAYPVFGFVLLFIIANGINIIRRQIPQFSIRSYISGAIRNYAVILLSALPLIPLHALLTESFFRLLLSFLLYILILFPLAWFLLLTPSNRRTLLATIK